MTVATPPRDGPHRRGCRDGDHRARPRLPSAGRPLGLSGGVLPPGPQHTSSDSVRTDGDSEPAQQRGGAVVDEAESGLRESRILTS